MEPSLETRLDLRRRPPLRSSMRQRWSRLLFLHLEADPALLRPLLPPGLELDFHEGKTYLGIVPFFMERVRPTGLLPIPGLSWFLELNVRCYVTDPQGRPGVYFFSLDCNQPLAVVLARTFFHLPYRHAAMRSRILGRETFYHACRRGENPTFEITYRPEKPLGPAVPGSLEFFLVERYLLHTSLPGGALAGGLVHHSPYPLHTASWEGEALAPLLWNRLPCSGGFLPALYAESVEVEVFSLRRTP